jgi:hypothetical protein
MLPREKNIGTFNWEELDVANVRFRHKADIPYVAFDVAFGGKADMPFCTAHVRF